MRPALCSRPCWCGQVACALSPMVCSAQLAQCPSNNPANRLLVWYSVDGACMLCRLVCRREHTWMSACKAGGITGPCVMTLSEFCECSHAHAHMTRCMCSRGAACAHVIYFASHCVRAVWGGDLVRTRLARQGKGRPSSSVNLFSALYWLCFVLAVQYFVLHIQLGALYWLCSALYWMCCGANMAYAACVAFLWCAIAAVNAAHHACGASM
mmetsp:Transcript_7272/g.15876  ORF Transcript_7272/g.15876 Transcript_7272/m.15876 type:complete len:211 (-) Transcript_7272:33-665(-)